MLPPTGVTGCGNGAETGGDLQSARKSAKGCGAGLRRAAAFFEKARRFQPGTRLFLKNVGGEKIFYSVRRRARFSIQCGFEHQLNVTYYTIIWLLVRNGFDHAVRHTCDSRPEARASGTIELYAVRSHFEH